MGVPGGGFFDEAERRSPANLGGSALREVRVAGWPVWVEEQL